jgi:hypothetical protein
MPGSTVETQSLPVRVLHVHLFMVISVLGGAGEWEPSIPRMCILDTRTLWPRTNSVYTDRVLGVEQTPLTDKQPCLEHKWKISGLNDSQARCDIDSGGALTHRNSTNTEVSLVRAPHGKSEGLRTKGAFCLPCITDLYGAVRSFPASLSP